MQVATLFLSTFSTLLAIINPLESMPVFLKLLDGKDARTHRLVAWRACRYATLLLLFFLIFGTLLLEIFGVPLSMVRIVGGIILMRIGFSLFMPSAASPLAADPENGNGNIAFVPLAMPLMVGPGAIATVLGMASLVKHPLFHLPSLAAIVAAILADVRDLSGPCLCRHDPRPHRLAGRRCGDAHRRLFRRVDGHGADLPRRN